MTMQQNVDERDILRRNSAMRVRNALLELLRSWEEHEDLPRSVPTVKERQDRGGRAQLLGPHRGRLKQDD